MKIVDTVLEASSLTAPDRMTIRRLVLDSGIVGRDALEIVTRLVVWHLGRGQKPIRPSSTTMTPAEAYATDLLARRAWQIVDEHRDRLPPVEDAREGPAW